MIFHLFHGAAVVSLIFSHVHIFYTYFFFFRSSSSTAPVYIPLTFECNGGATYCTTLSKHPWPAVVIPIRPCSAELYSEWLCVEGASTITIIRRKRHPPSISEYLPVLKTVPCDVNSVSLPKLWLTSKRQYLPVCFSRLETTSTLSPPLGPIVFRREKVIIDVWEIHSKQLMSYPSNIKYASSR